MTKYLSITFFMLDFSSGFTKKLIGLNSNSSIAYCYFYYHLST